MADKKTNVKDMSWGTILEKTFNNFSTDKIHTAVPAQVVSFDADKRTISAQIVIKTLLVDNTTIDIPVIEDVPVIFPGGGEFELTYEILPDSYVLLIFSQRAIDQWLASGGIVNPLRTRKFAYTDAIAIPGILPIPDAESTAPVASSSIQLRSKDGSVAISVKSDSIKLDNSSGTVELKSSGQVDINGNLTINV